MYLHRYNRVINNQTLDKRDVAYWPMNVCALRVKLGKNKQWEPNKRASDKKSDVTPLMKRFRVTTFHQITMFDTAEIFSLHII